MDKLKGPVATAIIKQGILRKKEIIAYVQQIDDVRPVSSIVHWLYQEVKDDPHMLRLLGSAIVEVAAQLLEIPFVKDWFQRHGGTTRPVREEKFSWEWIPSEVLDTLENYITNPLVVLKSILSYAEDQGTAVHRKAALSDYRRLQDQGHQDVRFLLQGHTHVPDQCPLDRLKDAVGIYVNTGTWRPMFHETLAVEDGCGNDQH